MEYLSVEDRQPAINSWPDIHRNDGSVGTPAGTAIYESPPAVLMNGPDDTRFEWRSPKSSSRYPAVDNRIVMNPYSRGVIETRFSLARNRYTTRHRDWFWYHNGHTCAGQFSTKSDESHVLVRDAIVLEQTYPTFTDSYFSRHSVESAKAAAANACVAASHDGVDLLTEVAEAKATVKTVSDSVLGGQKLLRKAGEIITRRAGTARWKSLTPKALLRHSDKALRRAGDMWLSYTYGISPIVYTITGAIEEAENASRTYESYHSFREVSPEKKLLTFLPATYLLNEASGSIQIRATTRVFYSLGALQRLSDRINTNALKTGWELIPYSFVVDWFYNVGDVITAHTSLDMSTARGLCVSVKEDTVKTLTFHDTSEVTQDFTYQPGWEPCTAVLDSEVFVDRQDVHTKVREIVTRSYSREVLDSPPLKVSRDIYLDWKRFLSGLALFNQKRK